MSELQDSLKIKSHQVSDPIRFSRQVPMNPDVMRQIREHTRAVPAPEPTLPNTTLPTVNKGDPLAFIWDVTTLIDPDNHLAPLQASHQEDLSRFHYPAGIAVDTAGDIYVSDWGTRLVYKLASSDQKLLWVRDFGATGFPMGMTFGNNHLYVIDRGLWQIRRLDPVSGHDTVTFGRHALENGGLISPVHITTDSAGYVYVTDAQINRLHRFGPGGENPTFVQLFDPEDNTHLPSGVAVQGTGDNLKIYVTDVFQNQILYFDYNVFMPQTPPRTPDIWGLHGVRDGEFSGPVDIALGNGLHVLEQYNARVQRFAFDQAFVAKGGRHTSDFSSPGGTLNGPDAVALDSSGSIYIADTRNSRIFKASTLNAQTDSPEPPPRSKGFSVQTIDMRPGRWVRTLQQLEERVARSEQEYTLAQRDFDNAKQLPTQTSLWAQYQQTRIDLIAAAQEYWKLKEQETKPAMVDKIMAIPEQKITEVTLPSAAHQLIDEYLHYMLPHDAKNTMNEFIEGAAESEALQNAAQQMIELNNLYQELETRLEPGRPSASYEDFQQEEQTFLEAAQRFSRTKTIAQDNWQRAITWYQIQAESGWADERQNAPFVGYWKDVMLISRGNRDLHNGWDELARSARGLKNHQRAQESLQTLDLTSATFQDAYRALIRAENDRRQAQELLISFQTFLDIQGFGMVTLGLSHRLHGAHQQALQAYENLMDDVRSLGSAVDLRHYQLTQGELVDQYGMPLLEHVRQFKTLSDHRRENILIIPYQEDGDEQTDTFQRRLLVVYNPLFSGQHLHPLAIHFEEKFTLDILWAGTGLNELSHSVSLFPGEERQVTLTTSKKRSVETTEKTTTVTKTGRVEDGEATSTRKDDFESKLHTAFENTYASEQTRNKSNTNKLDNTASVGGSLFGLFKLGAAGSEGHESTAHTGSRFSLSSVSKKVSDVIKKTSAEVTQNNKVLVTSSTEAKESLEITEKTDDMQEETTEMTLRNINEGRTINYNFFQVSNIYNTILNATDLKLRINSGVELIAGTGLTISKTYEVEDYRRLLKDFDFYQPTADPRPLLLRAIAATIVHRYIAVNVDDISEDTPRLLREKGFTQTRLRTLQTQIEDAFYNAQWDAFLDDANPVAQELMAFSRLPLRVSPVKVGEEESHSVNTGNYYADAHLGFKPATEPYLEDRRDIETQRQYSLVTEQRSRTEAGVFHQTLPDNLKTLSISDKEITPVLPIEENTPTSTTT